MDWVFFQKYLYVIDYLKNKEFIVKKNIGRFLDAFNQVEIGFKLEVYSLIQQYVMGHPYSVIYSNVHFVDYRNTKTVAQLEKQITLSEQTPMYEECHAQDNVSYYFLNPILYRNKLVLLDKIGAILYFTCGVKCTAKWFRDDHIKKFLPSNGARYPFKVKIFLPETSKVQAGVYDYEMRSHGLVYSAKQKIGQKDHIKIFYYADMKRVMQRYPNGIAYRDLLFDFGHLIATIRKCLALYQIEVLDFQEFYTASDELQSTKLDLMHLPFLRIIVKYSHENQVEVESS